MTDQPTGPEAAADVAARMPGWKQIAKGHWRYTRPDGLLEVWTTRECPPGQAAKWFRPDCNVADAMEVAEALGMVLDIRRSYVWCHRPGACYCSTDIPRTGRTLVQAVCDAVCGVAMQLPLAREGREETT